jgi:hypothetical protein
MPTPTNPDLESWSNATRGTVFLRRFDHRGELNRIESVQSGKTFHLSPEERRINSEMAAEQDLDVFRNGTLTPVRLIEDSAEARELASNPNVMSETDMRALLKVHPKTFESKIKAVRNPVTLERLLAVAHEEDASIKRVESVQARLAEVAPHLAGSRTTSGTDQAGSRRPVASR